MLIIINIQYLLGVGHWILSKDYLIQTSKQLFPISYLHRSALMQPPPGYFTLIGYLFCGSTHTLFAQMICPVSLRKISQDAGTKMFLSLFPENICFTGI